jgi:diaminopimelate decarboxylase
MAFLHKNGRLHCNSVDLTQLAERYGTPLYVYDGVGIAEQVKRLSGAFRKQGIEARLHYSVKANSNLSVLRHLRALGCGFDIVSGGELVRTQRIGAAGSEVVFAGVGKTAAEIRAGLEGSVLQFNAESESEIELIAEEARKMNRKAPCALRINPDVDALTHQYITTGTRDSKFGISLDQAMKLYQRYRSHPHMDWVGLDMHIGSQLTEEGPILASLRKFAAFARDLLTQGFPIKNLDIGGGLGIRYRNESVISAERFAELTREGLEGLPLAQLQVLMEPGRFLVGEAGVLLTKLLHVKHSAQGKVFYVVDAAVSELMRPALYGAHHEIEAVEAAGAQADKQLADIVGPICESSDCLGKERELPALQAGALMIIRNAGAYGSSMGNTYNTRRRPPEILCSESESKLVRRADTYEDLLRTELELG